MSSASVMEDFTLEERRPLEFYWKPDKYFGKCAVVKHFVSLGIQEKILNRALAKFECGKKLQRKPGSGRRVDITIIDLFVNNVSKF